MKKLQHYYFEYISCLNIYKAEKKFCIYKRYMYDLIRKIFDLFINYTYVEIVIIFVID